MEIEQHKLKSNGFFGIVEEPHEHKQHSNQQGGLDLYVTLINFSTGEQCHKKLYQNTKGLHFKHSGGYWNKQPASGTHYLDSFTEEVLYVPFQIIELEE